MSSMARLLRSKSARDLKRNPLSSHPDFDIEPTPAIPRAFRSNTLPESPSTYEFTEEQAVSMKISTASLKRGKSISKKKSGVLREVEPPLPTPRTVETTARVLKKRRDPSSSNLATPTYQVQSTSSSSLAPPLPIGMAVGSPRELQYGRSPARSPVPSSRSVSPAYAYSTSTSKYGTDTVVTGGKENLPVGENSRGWKKLFGKGFFNKKAEGERPKSRKALSSRSMNDSPNPESIRSSIHHDEVESQIVPIIVEQAPPSPAPMPLLNIEIPEVRMERYSVMFGSIMQQNNNRASLYARRKSREVRGANYSPDVRYLDVLFTFRLLTNFQDGQPRLFLNSLKRNATTGQISRSPRTPRSPDFFSSTSNLQSLQNNYLHPNDVPSPTKKRLTFQRDSTVMPSLYFMSHLSQSVPEFIEEERNCEILEDEPIIHAVASSRAETVVVSSPESVHSKASESIKTPTGSFDAGDDVWLHNEGTWLASASPSEATHHSSPDIENTIKAAQMSIARQIEMSQQQLLLPIIRTRSQKAVFASALSPEAWAKSPYSPGIIRESDEDQYIATAM